MPADSETAKMSGEELIVGGQVQLNAKHMTLKQTDDQPYYTKETARAPFPLEPTYLSPHFNLQDQSMVQPRHLEEMAFFLSSNSKFEPFEKDYLIARLMNQGSIEIFGRDKVQALIKKLKEVNKESR